MLKMIILVSFFNLFNILLHYSFIQSYHYIFVINFIILKNINTQPNILHLNNNGGGMYE